MLVSSPFTIRWNELAATTSFGQSRGGWIEQATIIDTSDHGKRRRIPSSLNGKSAEAHDLHPHVAIYRWPVDSPETLN
jgi:hypothetical protein